MAQSEMIGQIDNKKVVFVSMVHYTIADLKTLRAKGSNPRSRYFWLILSSSFIITCYSTLGGAKSSEGQI